MTHNNTPLPRNLRAWGILPLLFFMAHLLAFIRQDEWGTIFWICHMSNLTLALGLFFSSPRTIRASVIWLTIGFPVWIFGVTQFGIETPTTLGTHVGGFFVGVIVLTKVRGGRHIWHYALGWFVLLQVISRLITPPSYNINAAHDFYFGWETRFFSSFALYWVFTVVMAGITLFFLEWLYFKLLPPPPVQASSLAY